MAEAAAPIAAASAALRRTTTGVPASSAVVSRVRSSAVSSAASRPSSYMALTGCPSLLTLQGGDHVIEVVRLDQHVAGLGALAGADDATALQDVHQAPGLREADAQLAL